MLACTRLALHKGKEMRQVQRFDMRGNTWPSEDGEIVSYKDYAALEKERNAEYENWQKQCATLQQKLDAANTELARYSMSAGQADQFAAEAKAVRKALGYAENAEDVAPVDLLEKIAGLRAEGVEMCAAKMKQTSSLSLNHIAEGILQYAAELRAETDTTPSQYESLAGGK